jgi:hypothetical protein
VSYAFIQDVPITQAVYAEIIADLGQDPPDGLIVHIAQVLDDGHLQYLDVWESEAHCDRFTDHRLHPVIGRVLSRHNIRVEGGEPPRRSLQIAHVWGAALSDLPSPAKA